MGGTDQLLFANYAAAMHKLIDRYQFRKRNTTNRRLSTCTYSRTHKRANAWTRRDFGGKSRHITQPVRAYRPKPVSGRIGHEICVPMEAAKGECWDGLLGARAEESMAPAGECFSLRRRPFPTTLPDPALCPLLSSLVRLVRLRITLRQAASTRNPPARC